MRDVTQGRLLFMLSILAMIAYFWALFMVPSDVRLLGKTVSEWALIIPVLIFVFLFLFVVAWIGWAMATTPPNLPIKDKETEEKENEEGKQSS